MINKKIIKHNFSDKAAIYNDCALIQKDAAQKLYNLGKNFVKDNAAILDLGSGTSFIAKNLLNSTAKNLQIFEVDIADNMLKNWRDRPQNIFPILADIENLPFKKQETFDIIFSSFALQWLENFEELFHNLHLLLKKNGIIIICLPTENSFIEIRDASKSSGCNFLMQKLVNQDFIKEILLKIGFKEKYFANEVIKQKHKNAVAALKDFKKIGTNYSESSAVKKFVTKRNLQKFNVFFSQNSSNNTSWHLCFLIYQK